MHFHYKVATTLSLLLLVSFVFQLISLLSVPITSTITLCTYDGYKFGVFGFCSISSNTCSRVEIGYSKTTIDELKGFSLPSNTRHSISSLLIVHPISTGFTFILLVMSVLTHFKVFNRSLRFLFLLILWCFVTFLLCLLSFLVDILLFIPHLDWGGWIVLASTVLIAIAGTVVCIMRRTASSRNLYDFKKQNQNGNVEMYSMLPMKESYGYVRDNNDITESNTISDSDDEEDDDDDENNGDHTNQHLLYDDETSTQPTDIVRNEGGLAYRGYHNNNNNNNNPEVYAASNIINDEDEDDAYYNYNPMSSNDKYTRTPRNSSIIQRNSIISLRPPPGRATLPYPAEEPTLTEDNTIVSPLLPLAPYPAEEDFVDARSQNSTINGDEQAIEPTIPRISTPPMDEEAYQPQPVKISPIRGPRPIPQDPLPPVPDKIPLEEEEEEAEDEFIFLDSRNTSRGTEFKKPFNNQTQTSLTTNSTLQHKNLNNIVGQNHQRFISNSTSLPAASSYYGDDDDGESSVAFKADNSVIDESDKSSQEDEIPSSEYLEFNEENLSEFNGIVGNKKLFKKLSMDSIASSNFTSISQRPVNPRYYEKDAASKRTQPQRPVHPFRAQLVAKSSNKEEKLKRTRERLNSGEF